MAVILFFFLGTLRPTIIALTAIPVSIFITALVFKYFGSSINTMTLGGLAIAIGELVDDAVAKGGKLLLGGLFIHGDPGKLSVTP